MAAEEAGEARQDIGGGEPFAFGTPVDDDVEDGVFAGERLPPTAGESTEPFGMDGGELGKGECVARWRIAMGDDVPCVIGKKAAMTE